MWYPDAQTLHSCFDLPRSVGARQRRCDIAGNLVTADAVSLSPCRHWPRWLSPAQGDSESLSVQRAQLSGERHDAQAGAVPAPGSLHGFSLPRQPRLSQPSLLGHAHVGCARPGPAATAHWPGEPALLPAITSRAAPTHPCPAGSGAGVPRGGLFELLSPVPAAQRGFACMLPLQKSQETPERGELWGSGRWDGVSWLGQRGLSAPFTVLPALSFPVDVPGTLSFSRDLLPGSLLLQELWADPPAEGKSWPAEEVPAAPAQLLRVGGCPPETREEENVGRLGRGGDTSALAHRATAPARLWEGQGTARDAVSNVTSLAINVL